MRTKVLEQGAKGQPIYIFKNYTRGNQKPKIDFSPIISPQLNFSPIRLLEQNMKVHYTIVMNNDMNFTRLASINMSHLLN